MPSAHAIGVSLFFCFFVYTLYDQQMPSVRVILVLNYRIRAIQDHLKVKTEKDTSRLIETFFAYKIVEGYTVTNL